MPDDNANATTAAPRDRSPLASELLQHGSLLALLVKEFDTLEERMRNVLRPPGPPSPTPEAGNPSAVATPSPHVSTVLVHQSLVQQMIGRLKDLRDRLEA